MIVIPDGLNIKITILGTGKSGRISEVAVMLEWSFGSAVWVYTGDVLTKRNRA